MLPSIKYAVDRRAQPRTEKERSFQRNRFAIAVEAFLTEGKKVKSQLNSVHRRPPKVGFRERCRCLSYEWSEGRVTLLTDVIRDIIRKTSRHMASV